MAWPTCRSGCSTHKMQKEMGWNIEWAVRLSKRTVELFLTLLPCIPLAQSRAAERENTKWTFSTYMLVGNNNFVPMSWHEGMWRGYNYTQFIFNLYARWRVFSFTGRPLYSRKKLRRCQLNRTLDDARCSSAVVGKEKSLLNPPWKNHRF